MIPVDAGFVYPKTGLDADLRMDLAPTYVSSGSLYLPGGSTDDVEVDGLSWTSDGAWSFSCWVKSNDLTTASNKKFFSVHASGNSHRIDFQASSDADLQIYTDVSSSQPTHTFTGAATAIQDGTWHHVALVAATSSSNSVYRVFIDGQQFGADSSACARPDISSADSGYIGNLYNGSGAALTANLAHVGFWNAALSEAQVRSLMTATTYAEAVTRGGSTPAAYYLFEANANTSVGSDNGTLGGSAVIVGDRAKAPNGFDLTGNRLDARCVSGRAWVGDGAGDFLTTELGAGLGDTFSISIWGKRDAGTGATTDYLINTGSPSGAGNGISISITNNNPGLAYFFDNGTSVNTTSRILYGKWHHYVLTVAPGAGNVKLYVDGVDGTPSHSVDVDISDTTFDVGRYLGNAHFFIGSLADIRVYNATLSQAQVTEIFNSPSGSLIPTGLAAANLLNWWPLADYDVTGTDSCDGLFFQDAKGSKPLLSTNGIMEFAQPNIFQLGLRSSSSRVLVNNVSGKQASATLQSAPGTTFTVACWFMEMANDDTNIVWRIGGTNSADDDFLEMYLNSSGVLQVYGDGTVSAGSPAIGEWHHVVVVSDGSTPYCKVYVDNSEITTSGALGQAVDISTATLIIGDHMPGMSSAIPFDGIISEIAVWDSALTSGNVSTLWNSGVQGADANAVDGGNLLNWYKCDNPKTLVNLSDNSTHAATYAGLGQNMVTVPEGTTANLSAFGSLTTKRAYGGIAGIVGYQTQYNVPWGNCAKLPHIELGTNAFTISFWFKVQDSGAVSNGRILDFYSTYGIQVFYSDETHLKVFLKGASGTPSAPNTSLTSSQMFDTWAHLVIRREAAATFSFVYHPLDQSAVAISDSTGTDAGDMTPAGNLPLVLGGTPGASNQFATNTGASFADIRIWNGDAITDAQVSALYESGARMLRGL